MLEEYVICFDEILLIEILSSSSFKFNMKHSGNRSSDRFSLWNLSMYFINDLVNFLLQRNNSCATVACWHMGRKLWTHILQSDKVCKRKRTNDFVFLPFDIKELSKWKEKIQITHFLFIFPCNITHDSKSKIFTYDTICYTDMNIKHNIWITRIKQINFGKYNE